MLAKKKDKETKGEKKKDKGKEPKYLGFVDKDSYTSIPKGDSIGSIVCKGSFVIPE